MEKCEVLLVIKIFQIFHDTFLINTSHWKNLWPSYHKFQLSLAGRLNGNRPGVIVLIFQKGNHWWSKGTGWCGAQSVLEQSELGLSLGQRCYTSRSLSPNKTKICQKGARKQIKQKAQHWENWAPQGLVKEIKPKDALDVFINICAYMSTYICVDLHTYANIYKYLFIKRAD